MAGFKPTEAQREAIESRNRGSAVLVSANAGSGKTKVLTERLMGYITDEKSPADIDSFVIITFTKAAAAELKSRISDELSELSLANPDNEHIRRQSALLRKTHIGTIHSFCSSILRENSHAAGIPSDFSVVSDERAEAMKASALDKVLNSFYENIEDDPEFEMLVNTVGAGNNDGVLVGIISELYEKMQCHSRPDKWIEKIIADLETPYDDPAKSPWGNVIIEFAKEKLDYYSEELDALLLEIQQDEVIRRAYTDSLSETAAGVRAFKRAIEEGWDAASHCSGIEFGRFGSCRNCDNEQLKEKAKLCRDRVKNGTSKLREIFKQDSEAFKQEMQNIAPPMKALLRVTSAFADEYSRSKKRAGLVDYSDLEHMSAALLKDEKGNITPLAENISARYTEIMVDEYQDVSRVQDDIFDAVSDNSNKLFMVGDAKQSIYRFRLADPAIFNEKYCSFKFPSEVLNGGSEKITLRENFRSDKEILECANAVFSRTMTKALGDITYGEDTMLIHGLPDAENAEKILPEIIIYKVDPEDKLSKDRRNAEARMVAEKIRRLVAENKNIRYRDIAILIRNANSVGKIFSRELAALGIPAATGAGGDFFKSEEVVFVISLLKVMDNPHMDIPLLTVLSSPAFGFTPDELSAIRIHDKKTDIYGALIAAAETDDKCRDFLKKLDYLRENAPDLTADRIIWQIFDISNIQMICSAMKDSRQKLADLMYLVQLAVSFESDGYHGLHNFVLYLQRLAAKGMASPSLGERNDAVTIMSVHKSKGLEFPIVFLCDTDHQFNSEDIRDSVIVHPELGLGPQVVDNIRKVKYPSIVKNAISMKLKRENLSEEMRLLYVALTRPKHRLYITAAKKDPEKYCEDICGKMISVKSSSALHPEALAGASCMLDWLTAAYFADGGEHIALKVVETETENTLQTDVPENFSDEETETYEELQRNLSFKYPYEESERLPSKVTATELKKISRTVDEEEDIETFSIVPERKVRFRKPDLGKADRPAAGAERGIATHLALQYMNPEKTDSIENVRAELERLKDKKFLSERQAEAVNADAIVKLFASELGRRIKNADKVHREFRFSILCSASEIMDSSSEEKVLLQGVVDCCLEENGQLVIIDYKTDHISSAADLEEKKAFYSSQIKAYALALGRIFAMPVKETVLYFLSAGKEIII